ncbi:hypothetical protein [Streptomyces hesseae]|uniref:ANTAR domain-containing protein n=1 Tax=Streptomyces hesseae TaxID=3075519 RepID=A0ABU2SPF0_9ACTN|nr:hypothetical protein [Streptomyces sp. DSM 40473]MDT0450866.1 hypothetical protein [Streptomyces sp. DSM 40473]
MFGRSKDRDQGGDKGRDKGRDMDPGVVVLRDSQALADAVREALETASEAERPGLERAAGLIALHAARPEREIRAEWTRGILATAGVDPREQEVHAVRALRRAEPGLSLKSAVQLVREAVDPA